MDWQWERASSDLLQNCDLPPPLKLLSPLDKQEKRPISKIAQWEAELEPTNQTENTSLLRALRLSQSRAREAERKAAATSTNNEKMASLLLDDALRLSAHRRWVRLLETEIFLLRRNNKLQSECYNKTRREEEDDDEVNVPALTWCLTLALCLGIGFALGQYVF